MLEGEKKCISMTVILQDANVVKLGGWEGKKGRTRGSYGGASAEALQQEGPQKHHDT